MISVCIPTYNGEKYIKEQIESILNQLGPNDEIIISDDDSSDDTIILLSKMYDARIKIYKNTKVNNSFKGLFRTLFLVNRNVQNALNYATGDYIFLADQDDIWESNKVEIILPLLKKYDLVVHNCTVFESESQVILQNSYYDVVKPSSNLLRTLFKSSFHGCCMAFNASLKEEVLPIPKLGIGHDTWIGINAILKCKILFIDDKLLRYRRHEKNVSSGEISNNSLWFKIKYRFFLLYAVLLARK